MGEPYEISKAQAQDIEAIKAIEVECRLSPWTIAGYESELRRPDALILKASTGIGAIVGFVAGRVPLSDYGEAAINNIATLPGYREQGIGRKLLEHFRSECVKRCASGIWLEVRASNAKAIKFYILGGFSIRGRRPNFYSNPSEDAEIMHLQLDTSAVLPKS